MSEDLFVDVWDVVAHAFPDAESAEREWIRLRDEFPGGNFSVWRTLQPESGVWMVVACGHPDDLPSFGGQPVAMTEAEAEQFVARRMRLVMDTISAGERRATHVERYGDTGGRVIRPDGRLRRNR